MSSIFSSPIAKHRAQRVRQGYVRVEVSVPKADASVIRQVASALADPARQASTRVMLQQHFAASPQMSRKALLASAPLDGIVLERDHDTDRDGTF